METKTRAKYHAGEWIVHYFHGVGKIEEIVDKGLPGKEKTYYRVSTGEMKYWLPVEDQDSNHIKPIRTKSEFDEALVELGKAPKSLANNYRTRWAKKYSLSSR